MMIRIKLVATEIAFSEPVDGFDASASQLYPDIKLYRVPTLKVFGITESGQRVCAHVHQVVKTHITYIICCR